MYHSKTVINLLCYTIAYLYPLYHLQYFDLGIFMTLFVYYEKDVWNY